jgi:hypothetical protein
VNHNRAKLYLHGGAGNDRFLLKTFLVLRENSDNPDEVTNLAALFGGAGFNRYDYLQNAPVEINGGTGIDTIVIVGTPIGDVFIVTDTYIAGAGRIVNFTNIEAIEVDGGGGPDQIYVLSTSNQFETTAVGGSGDDTIHVGGTPPPLVFDPPPFTYTPPAIQIQLPPEVVYQDFTWDLGGLKYDFELDFWNTILAAFGLGGSVDQAARGVLRDKINAVFQLWDNLNPYFQGLPFDVNTADIEINSRLKWNFFIPSTVIEVRVRSFSINYQIGHLEARTRLVQPPSITVDQPTFVFQADGVNNLAGIQGKLRINGGDLFEDTGDRVFVHNQDGPSGIGSLITRSSPRLVAVGEDSLGNEIFAQDRDQDTNALIFDTYRSLEGLGQQFGRIGRDTVSFNGVWLDGIENLDLRLAGGDDTFTFAPEAPGVQATLQAVSSIVVTGGPRQDSGGHGRHHGAGRCG